MKFDYVTVDLTRDKENLSKKVNTLKGLNDDL